MTMNIIEEIAVRVELDVIATGRSSSVKPTVFVGEVEMAELLEFLKDSKTIAIEKNCVGEDRLMGMPLVQVKAREYLRVA